MRHEPHRNPRAFCLGLLLALFIAAFPAAASAASSCQTSGPDSGSFAITVCLDVPDDGATLSGDMTVSGSTSAMGPAPGVQRLRFYVDGEYTLTDYEAPYTFTLPTARWADGPHRIEVEAFARDGLTYPSDPSQRAGVNVTFSNGVTTPPVNTNQWPGATSGTTPAPGKPFVLAAVGDGAGGELSEQSVVNRIKGWSPNLFLYLGDVYEKGAPTEFKNWYGSPTSPYYGQFRSITNPVVGNHEYSSSDTAAGYFDFWDNIPHYYSYNANGWHFIALDSTSQFSRTPAWQEQYDWLVQDLAQHDGECTIAYYHHPLFNIGEETPAQRMDQVWRLLADNGVAMVLNGHDHDYQRWVPMDGDGTAAPGGVTEFVAGTGGHSEQSIVGTDSRVAFSNTQFGALRLELNQSGAAYQFVTAGGTRLDSGSLQCPGTPADSVAPTTPTGLTAVAHSRAEIELSWNQSSDNVGVTGYDIYRDGSLLKTVGPETTSTDGAAAPGTTYTYTVKAHDAAGNKSNASAQAQATTPALGVLFSDDFEKGNLANWTTQGTNGLKVVSGATGPVFSGSWSARAQNAGANLGAWAGERLATDRTNLYYQTHVRVASQGTRPINLMRFRSSSGATILSVMRTAAGKLTVKNASDSAVSGAALPTLSTGKWWYTIQVHVQINVNGDPSQVDVQLDGEPVSALSLTMPLGSAPIGFVDLGEYTPSRVYDVNFDDVAVDNNPIPDVSAPSIPASLTATAASGLQVDLQWAASADDVSATDYDIYRNDTLLDSQSAKLICVNSTCSFHDTTVAPQSSYFYQVRARDGGGNASSLSDIAAVTTPAVFSDGFESGDMSRWDPGSDQLSPVSGAGFSGSYGARATVSGLPVVAVKTLPAAQSDLYYRVRFKIESQGALSAINLLRFRTNSMSVFTVSVSAGGMLSARNDAVGGASTVQSDKQIVPGVWYELQAHLLVQGDTGQSDVWLNGEPVSALSKVDNFGSIGISKLDLGDSTGGHTFSALFDDVLVTGSFIEDDTPPAPPTGLTATSVASNQVTLSWTSATDNLGVTSYDVYRNGALIHNMPPDTTFTDTTLEPNHTYRYEVRANDDAGNSSGASNPVTVNTAGIDTTAPTKPTELAATVVAPSQINLQWTAATDDVGVTTYRIFRNGNFMTAVDGDQTTYQDTATLGDSTYSYTVEAADAAGNLSEQSDAASATTPHAALFFDGFESGVLATKGWTRTGTVNVQGSQVASGAWAAETTGSGSAAWAWAPLPSDQTEITYSMRFRPQSIASGNANTTLLKMRTASNAAIFGVQIQKNRNLAVRNDAVSPGTTTVTSANVSTVKWYTLEAHLVIGGSASSYEVKLDGASVLSGQGNFGTTAIGRIQFGESSSSRTFDIFFDDIQVDVPQAMPTLPQNVSRPAITGTPVDQETLTADTGTWTAGPETVYAYQWRDCDASGFNCTDIAGATSKTYNLRASDIGHTIAVTVTATNGTGAASATSDATAVVAAAGPTNLGAPTITGAPVDGQQLSASHGIWRGTLPIDYSYQWQRCNGSTCVDISTATDDTYTLGSGDVGSTIKVAVTASNSGGSATVISDGTNIVGGVPPDNTSRPTISGTTDDGQTLSADKGTWSGTTPIDYAYQWQRCDADGTNCTDISSATDAHYTLTSDDVGSTIAVNVTATNAAGPVSASSAVTAAISAVAPANTTLPSISGTAQDGETLSANRGAWSGTTPIGYAYQWQRCDSGGGNCADIDSATSSDYQLSSADIGSTILVRATATNSAGSADASSMTTDAVATAAPANTAPPSISGAPIDGEQLTGSVGTWTGSEPIDYSYQWQRCDSGGANCTDIASATDVTYTLQGGDIGSTVRFVVTASNGAGGTSADSAATNVVDAAAPANTIAPSISGTARDGETLTVDKGTWSGSDPIDYAYRWQRCAADGSSCSDIAGATDTTYTLTSDDVGSTIAATVAADNAGGSATATAPVTDVIAGITPANTTVPSISGVLVDGQALTADKGSWTGSTPIDYAYQWRACDPDGLTCTDIAGATDSSYRLQSSDVDQRIKVDVTATNSAGSATATSDPSDAVAPTPPVNDSAPTISGTVKVGSTLTAHDGSWSGTDPIDYSYQWQRCESDGMACSDVPDATAGMYVIVADDLGHVLHVVVSAHNAGATTTATSADTSVVQPADVPPQNIAAPTIRGTAQDGETLTADTGTWTGTEPFTYTYQWRDCDADGLNCTDIDGATDGTYVLRSSDVGSAVIIAVTAANDSGPAEATSAPTAIVAGTVPANTTAPSISGDAKVGSTLTGDNGSWTGTTPIDYAYQWQRCDADGTNCSDITDATTTSYAVQPDDFGRRLHLVVTASNGVGTSSETSADTDPVVAAPANTTAPSISGAPSDGATLTVDHGTWSGTDPIDYAYQWQRCAADGTGCEDIANATAETYDVIGADAGSALRVVVTATNAVGSETAHSDPTTTVSAAGPTNTAAPSISGTMREGSILTADKGTWSGTEPIDYAYQWRRCNSDGSGCADVAGATAATYVLSTADSGKAVQVRVTGTNGAGSSSALSATVALRTPLFAEGFESGLTRWTNFGLTTWQTDAFAGSSSARAFSTAGTASYATAPLSPAQIDLTYRLHFKGNNATWPSTGVYLLKLRTAANASVVGVYVTSTGRLSYRNDVGAVAFSSPTVVSPGAWHEISVHVTIAGTSGSIDLTLDGTHVFGFPRPENFGTTAIGKIQVGDNSTGRNFDVSADEVVVDNGS